MNFGLNCKNNVSFSASYQISGNFNDINNLSAALEPYKEDIKSLPDNLNIHVTREGVIISDRDNLVDVVKISPEQIFSKKIEDVFEKRSNTTIAKKTEDISERKTVNVFDNAMAVLKNGQNYIQKRHLTDNPGLACANLLNLLKTNQVDIMNNMKS